MAGKHQRLQLRQQRVGRKAGFFCGRVDPFSAAATEAYPVATKQIGCSWHGCCDLSDCLAEIDIRHGRSFIHGPIEPSGSIMSVSLQAFPRLVVALSQTRRNDQTAPARCGSTTVRARKRHSLPGTSL
ncbi:hypothetical protein D3C87_1851910 [compost metagenome]